MVIYKATKPKVNAKGSTESDLIAVDDIISKVIWTIDSWKHKGYKIKSNIIYQDNTNEMKLETKYKASSGKCTRHFDVKLFYITDLINTEEIEIMYCPTHEKTTHWNQIQELQKLYVED